MFNSYKAPADEDDAILEVRRYAKWVLQKAGVGSRLPTPVDDIVACANLAVSRDISLSEIHRGFFSKAYGILAAALSKLRALIDLRSDTIYLDLSMRPQQINFAKLHDCAHATLPWQRNAYRYEDDDRTLSPDVGAHFEKEANWFAAEVLFQLDRFTRQAADMPLSVRTPVELSKRYGASCHAAIRRYVEYHHEPCAVIVCRSLSLDGEGLRQLEIEHIIYSLAFRDRFGRLELPRPLDPQHIFAKLAFEDGVRLTEDGTADLASEKASTFHARVHIFNSTYRIFVLVYPVGASRRGWKRIIPAA